MSGIGKSKTGHLARKDAEDRGLCGRKLRVGVYFTDPNVELRVGVYFTDPNVEPHLCLTCERSFLKSSDGDHAHVIFQDGKWRASCQRRGWHLVAVGGSATVLSASLACRVVPGCSRMVPCHIGPMSYNLGTAGSNSVWTWAS